jgi:hypothetical protein
MKNPHLKKRGILKDFIVSKLRKDFSIKQLEIYPK